MSWIRKDVIRMVRIVLLAGCIAAALSGSGAKAPSVWRDGMILASAKTSQ